MTATLPETNTTSGTVVATMDPPQGEDATEAKETQGCPPAQESDHNPVVSCGFSLGCLVEIGDSVPLKRHEGELSPSFAAQLRG